MTVFKLIQHQLLSLLFILALWVNPAAASEASLLFSPNRVELQDNAEVVISVMLNTAGVRVNGAGAQITFDPNYLTAVRVHPSDIFADYPAAIIDNGTGKITISGISASADDLFIGEAKFADLVFRPHRQGTSKVQFVFMPGSTTDSNIAVMTGNGDILAKVNELTITMHGATSGGGDNVGTVTPSVDDSAGTATAAIAATQPSLLTKLKQNEMIAVVASYFGWNNVAEQYAAARPGRDAVTTMTTDPLAPIVRQNPITDPLTTQPVAAAPAQSSLIWLWAALALILVLLALWIWMFWRRKQAAQTPPEVFELPERDEVGE